MSAVSFDSEKLADVMASPNTEPIKKDVEVEIVAAAKPAEPAFEQESFGSRVAGFGKDLVPHFSQQKVGGGLKAA